MTEKAGHLALHDCVRRGDLAKLTKLLEHGCPVDERDEFGWTPLCLATWRGYQKIVNLLIRHGADVSVTDTPFHQTPLHASAWLGHKEIVEDLIEHGADVNVKDKDGKTPLHRSASHGHKEVVKLLIQNGAHVDAVDWRGFTPLMRAEERGHIVVGYILRQAKPVQAVHRKFWSSIHDVSTHSSRSEKVKCSTNAESISITEKAEKLILHDCVRREDLDMVIKLLENRWPVDVQDGDGWTPLYIAAWLGHTEIVEVLIRHGANINKTDKYGWSPLQYNAYYGHTETVKLLISHGAHVDTKDTYGDTPLAKSAFAGHKEIVDLCISHGADVNGKDKYGQVPLHKCASEGHTEIVEILIHHGADINVKDEYGQMALYKSGREGHTDTVEVLISYGADVNVKDRDGRTPLHKSAREGQTQMAEILIYHGADVNLKDKYGLTPLHISAQFGNEEIVELLIQHGADIDPVDDYGDTPLKLANICGNSGIVDILRQAKPVQAGDNIIMRVFAAVFGYSSSTRRVTIKRPDGNGQIKKFRYESSEVRSQMTGSFMTFEADYEENVDKVKVNTQKGSQGHKVRAPPSTSTPLPTSVSPPKPRNKVTQLVQELLNALEIKEKSDENDGGGCQDQDSRYDQSGHLDGNVFIIQQKTEHYHYHNCHCNNKHDTCEEVKHERLETLDVSVGDTKHRPQHLLEFNNQRKEKNEDKYIYGTGDDKEMDGGRRDGQTLEVDTADKTYARVPAQATRESSLPRKKTPSSASTSVSTTTSATEVRHRLQSQAGYLEKMVQSCVAGGGVCQDQSSDLAPLHHGGLHVPVNLNFIMQPKHVEVWSTKNVKCEKAEVENAEMVAVNSPFINNYETEKSSDDEDEDSTDDYGKDDNVVYTVDSQD